MAVSRQREYLADATSVQFTRNPDGLISALQQARRGGRALSRSEPCHAASLHRQPRADLHSQDTRRSWRRIPTIGRSHRSPAQSGRLAPWPPQAFDLQGHRGARGLAPENTLAAFRKALDARRHHARDRPRDHQGRHLVLSHDPRAQPRPDARAGRPVARRGRPGDPVADARPSFGATTSAGSIRRAATARQYPQQKPADGERFPTLAEFFAAGRRRRCASTSRSRSIPTKPGADARSRPRSPRLVVDAVRDGRGWSGAPSIQSFDWRAADRVRRIAPEIETVCLTIESTNIEHRAPGTRALALAGRPETLGPWRLGAAAGQGGRLQHLVAVLAQHHARRPWPRRRRSASRSFPGRSTTRPKWPA